MPGDRALKLRGLGATQSGGGPVERERAIALERERRLAELTASQGHARCSCGLVFNRG
jgi:hypothetical protein